MFGYACNETDDFMPLTLDLSHKLLRVLAEIRKEWKEMTYLRPDAKSQFTIEYSDDDKPISIKTIILSTQHDEFAWDEEMLNKIREDVKNIVLMLGGLLLRGLKKVQLFLFISWILNRSQYLILRLLRLLMTKVYLLSKM